VTLLLCCPLPVPPRPGVVARTSLVPDAVQRVEHVHVAGKGLLRDHVPNQDRHILGGEL